VKSVNGELQAVLQRVVVEHFFYPPAKWSRVWTKNKCFVVEAQIFREAALGWTKKPFARHVKNSAK
jgi:hypothetical protein